MFQEGLKELKFLFSFQFTGTIAKVQMRRAQQLSFRPGCSLHTD